MLLTPQHEIGLHGTAHRVHMAVRVLARQDILPSREGVPIPVVGKVLDGKVFVARAGSALPGKEQVLGKGVRLVPAKGLVSVGARVLFVARQGPGRQVRHHRIQRRIEHFQRLRICGKLMSIDQADGDLVVGVGREAVVIPEVR